ncbi:MAG: discoidin domain-containing protein [Phycisphaerales bacterium]|nr:MAG: discoidin domain-containing protein [Phycisphaerales bacterium]
MRTSRILVVVLCLATVATGTASAALQDGLVAYYQFEGDLTDASGSGHDATASGGGEPAFALGLLGLAVDTREAAVDCGTWDPSDETTDAFSASCWVYWLGLEGAAAPWQGILAKRSGWGAGLSRWQLELGDTSATAWLTNQPNGGPGGVTLTADEWLHIAISYDGSDAGLYLNTEQVAGGGWTLDNGVDTPLCIGMSQPTNGNNFNGYIDEVGFWNRGLSAEEVTLLFNDGAGLAITGPPTTATRPEPADGAVDVAQDTALNWTPSAYAASHNVYLGTLWNDVNSASVSAPLGVLVSEGQAGSSFEPEGMLDFEQTYYWRVDEVNAAPDRTIFKGDVWSFTVEPFAYTIENVTATSNGNSQEGAGPENTVNGSGLNADGTHSIAATDMWLATPGADPLWLLFEFDQVYKLHEMQVWNYNVQFELVLGFGVKDVTLEYSTDGVDWTAFGDVQFAQATARADYTANTTIELAGVAAKFVRVNVNSGWGPMGQFGLSEVSFSYKPVVARQPEPADGQIDVGLDVPLDWRAGREVAVHEVYLSSDRDAVETGTAPVDTVGESRYAADNLDLGTTYYWKVDEVNEAATPSVWEGDIWSFSTLEFFVLEDFESYDDEDNRIYDTWLDGWVNETGSTVGYLEAPFAEQRIVQSGRQSMPLQYDNTVAPFYSEAERDLGGIDLAANGADTLRLFVAGLAPAFQESADGTILMNGIGADIWDVSDQFRYVYKNLTGNGSMVVRVDDLDGTPSAWVKAGVMVRQSTDAGSAHTMMVLTGGDGNGASWQGRPSNNVLSESEDATEAVTPPYWVKVERTDQSLSGSISPDGQTWTQVGTPRTVALDDSVLIGLALTSHNANRATSAQFSNVSFTGNVTGAWEIAEIGATQPEGNAPESVYVALEDTNGNVAVVMHPDAALTAWSRWTQWLIPYGDLAGINLDSVRTMVIGVGDRNNPAAGGVGTIFIDDVGYGKPGSVK